MRVGIVGGVERTERQLQRLAGRLGHELIFHPGHMTSRGAAALDHLIARCEVVVIVTGINSHGAVLRARRQLRLRGRSPVLLRRLGAARLEQLLLELAGESTSARQVEVT
jgi:hypothetical protein